MGSLFLAARMKVNSGGSATIQALGYSFDVVKSARTMDGTADGKPVASLADIWLSPPLRAALFTRIDDPNYRVTYTTAGINLDFKPAE